MEALRYSLLAPACGTLFMVMGCLHSITNMVDVRNAAKDDNGKPLFPLPYSPWTKVDPKYQDKADAAHRAFKMVENVKEWTFMSLPCMWLFTIFGGSLPYVNQDIIDVAVVASCLTYAVGNYWFAMGYISAPENRVKGFKLRLSVVKFWLLGSAASVFWASLQRFGVVG